MATSRAAAKKAREKAEEAIAAGRESVDSGVEAARLKSKEVGEEARERAKELREELARRTRELSDQAREGYASSVEHLESSYRHARDAVTTATEDLRRYTHDHPGWAVLLSFGVGFLFASILVPGRRETAVPDEG